MFNSRLTLPPSPDRGRSHPRRSDMSETPYTVLLRVRPLARASCTHDAQTRTARSSPHYTHLPPRKNHSLVTDGPLALFKTFEGFFFCQWGRWALQVDCPEVQPYSGSRLDLLSVARVTEINPFIFCFFQSPKYFGLF